MVFSERYFNLRTPDVALRIWRHSFVKSAESTQMIQQGQAEVNVSGKIIYSAEKKIRKGSEKTAPYHGGAEIQQFKK